MDPLSRQQGRVAIVTGGAGGIGAAIARQLAGDGARVVVLDLDEARARAVADGLPGDALGLACDITDRAAVLATVALVEERLGRIDVLVNNAGMLHNAPFLEMPVERWDEVVEANLTGPFQLTQAVARVMERAGYGRIVFVGSLAAQGNREQANYAAAKAGVFGLARTIAIELGGRGITCNVVAPGRVDSGLLRQALRDRGVDFDTWVVGAAASTAVGRIGRPEDIAEAVAFFALPGSGFTTGQVLYVTGDPTA